MTTPSEVADQLLAEATALELEVEEIDMLVAQARTEAGRHQTRRSAAADKMAQLSDAATTKEAVELANQVVTLTRRSALMDAQLEILEGKKRSTARLMDALRGSADKVLSIGSDAGNGGARPAGGAAAGGAAAGGAAAGGAAIGEAAVRAAPVASDDDEDGSVAPAVSRLVLAAQEDLRREIARAMHDGPAQSLTNIVLQAEIVERLVGRDPKLAIGEVRALVAMVQQTLEATKTFIFDVRPMVLDDLGLVPTLRRSARDRGQRAGITVEFATMGMDRRLAVEMESALFRIADEALAAYLGAKPDRASLSMDWGDSLVMTLRADKTPKTVAPLDIPEEGDTLPPALAEMVADRRRAHAAAIERSREAALVKLPPRLLRDLVQRAATLGIDCDVLEDGECLRLSAVMPALVEVATPA